MQNGARMAAGLAHDYLLVLRGAERTFAQIAACWPDAPIYTLLYDEGGTRKAFGGRSVRTSYLQKLHVRQRGFRRLLPLYPRAAERLPVEQHDIVVSSSSAFAHGIRPPDGTTHICYCHTPFRYVWHARPHAIQDFPWLARPVASRVLDRIRAWDHRAAQRVDHYIANGSITRDRIREYWGRDASIIHPPVETDRFTIAEPEDFFLVVTELVPHKRVDSALEAAGRAGRTMKVVGTGPSLEKLKARYGERADFEGRVDDRRLADLIARARAVVVPNVEEFGIVAVEAQAAGRPVLAPDRGGTSETVLDGRTGVLYPADDDDALAEAMRYVDFTRFEPPAIREHALQFRPEAFRERIVREVERLTGTPSGRRPA
jgi:glycosyltransferase involved in cell wall biosynthesis